MHRTVHVKPTRGRPILLSLGIGLLIAALLLLMPMPDMSRLFGYGMDFLHAPFFALFAFLLDQKRRRHQHENFCNLFFFWILLLILALGLEAAQSWVGRDSNWHDGLANILGITAGILFSFSHAMGNLSRKWLPRLLAILLIIAGCLYGVRGIWDTLQARYDFPVLADFESTDELLRWQTREAQLTQSSKHAVTGKFSGRLVLGVGRYPGVSIELPANDWSVYRWLKIDIVWPNKNSSSHVPHRVPKTLALRLKLEDQGPSNSIDDRFESTVLIHPGNNQIKIPLTEIANGPDNRLLRLDAMSTLSLFVTDLKNSRTLFIDQIRLE